MDKYLVVTSSGLHLLYAADDFDIVLSHVQKMGYKVKSIIYEGTYSQNSYSDLTEYTVIHE